MVILHSLLHQSCSHVCADTLSSQPHLYVLQMYQVLPYYFPTTSNGLLLKLGCTPPRESMIQMNGKQSADVQYPIQPLQKEKMNPDSLPNIIDRKSVV